jgi:hypothetical protein
MHSQERLTFGHKADGCPAHTANAELAAIPASVDFVMIAPLSRSNNAAWAMLRLLRAVYSWLQTVQPLAVDPALSCRMTKDKLVAGWHH